MAHTLSSILLSFPPCQVVDRAKASFKAGKLKSYEQRRNYLLQIDKFLKEQEQAIRAAQKADVGKVNHVIL